MNDFLDILKYILPSLVVFGASYYVMKLFIENESRQRMLKIKMENAKLITPIRLQAYERIILYLERITPSNLVMRLYKKDLSAIEFQSMLIQTIRDEYEHNLSQQIYVSETSWDMVKNAKEEVVKLINTSASSVDSSSSSTDLSHAIIQSALNMNVMPTQNAIKVVKKEIGKAF